MLLTTDRRIRCQQNLRALRIALVVLTGTTKWSLLREHTARIAAAVASATPGSYVEVDVPLLPKPRRSSTPNAAGSIPACDGARERPQVVDW